MSAITSFAIARSCGSEGTIGSIKPGNTLNGAVTGGISSSSRSRVLVLLCSSAARLEKFLPRRRTRSGTRSTTDVCPRGEAIRIAEQQHDANGWNTAIRHASTAYSFGRATSMTDANGRFAYGFLTDASRIATEGNTRGRATRAGRGLRI